MEQIEGSALRRVRRTGRKALAVAGAAALAAGVAACGSSGGTSGGGNEAAAATGTAKGVTIPQSDVGLPGLDAPDKPATGKPLRFAMISQENSPQGSFPEQREAGEAAIKYVNTKLGGIAGRPIQLDDCKTDGTPAGTSSCVNKLLQHQPIAFIGASDFNTYQSAPRVAKAGLAWIGGLSFGGPEAVLPNSFLFVAGSTTAWPAIPQFAIQQLHAKKVALTQPTGNPGAEVATKLVQNAIHKLGATDKTVPLDPTAADVTPQVTAMKASNPDAIVAINTGTQCVALAQARQSLGVQAPFFLPSGCAAPAQIKQIGSAAEGLYMPFEVEVPGDNGPDVRLYHAVMQKYAPDVPQNEFASSGFQSIINTYTVLHTMKPDQITSQSIIKAFQDARNVPNFMGPAFSCDRSVKAYPAVCNPKQMMGQYRDGHFVAVSGYYDPTPYVTTVKVG